MSLTGRVGIIAALALGMLSAPVAADAQPPKKVPRIGYLTLRSGPTEREEALRQGLRDLGYVEGQNIIIEYRFAGGTARLPEMAAELVRLKVDVFVASATPAVQAARNATRTIPIVMAAAADPLGTGFVASLARPGGNITGLSMMMPDLAGKRLELLREILPGVAHMAFLAHGADPAHRRFLQETEVAARKLGVQIQPVVVRGPDELEGAFSTMLRERVGALIVQPLFTIVPEHRRRVVDLATRSRLPAISDFREFADAGGLMSYGPHLLDQLRRAGYYVDRILKGASPGELPVEQPTRFEFVINLKTARALGLTIPQSVLLRADQVIQ